MSIRNIGKQFGGVGLVLGLVVAGFCLSGCGGRQQFAAVPPGLVASPDPGASTGAAPAPARTNSAAAPATTPSAPPLLAAPDLFRAGDSLTVVYADLPQATPSFQGKVKEDGTITLLLNKKFTAAGKTAGQLEEEIRSCYVPKYYKYLTVTVIPDVTTRWYYVNGEVRQPNRQIYNSRITVLQAITSAGGFTDFANRKKVKLTRVDGRAQTVNCVKAQVDSKLDPEVYPGDTIYVPRKLF